MLEKIYVEKYNASDDSFVLTEILLECGSKVSKGDIVFSVESSKADIDIESKHSGYIYFIVNLNDNIEVGSLFYIMAIQFSNFYDDYPDISEKIMVLINQLEDIIQSTFGLKADNW